MSDLSARLGASRERRRPQAITCFCENCDRVLYVADSDTLFCPVCSSLVARLDAEGLSDVLEEYPSAS